MPLVPLADTECEDLELALATNVLGPFRLTKALLGVARRVRARGRAPLVVNISSDAAVNAIRELGRLRREQGGARHLEPHLGRGADGRRHALSSSVDPGDMDTPLHALAVPDADRSTLKPPADAAREIAELIATHVAAVGPGCPTPGRPVQRDATPCEVIAMIAATNRVQRSARQIEAARRRRGGVHRTIARRRSAWPAAAPATS